MRVADIRDPGATCADSNGLNGFSEDPGKIKSLTCIRFYDRLG